MYHRGKLWCWRRVSGNERQSEGIGGWGWLGIVRERGVGGWGGVEYNKTFRFSPSLTLFPSFCLKTSFLNSLFWSLSLPTSTFISSYLSVFLFISSLTLSVWMWNTSVASMNSEMASFKPGRKGKKGKRMNRFLCSTVLCACCGRGGNCLLLSCQWCPGKALSVHKATKELSPKCEIATQIPLLFLSQFQNHIHTKRQTSKHTTNTTQK